MDKMDRLLYRMPSESPQPEITRRIAQYVRTRQRRTMRLRQGISILLAMVGAWFSMPLLGTMPHTLDLSGSGLPLVGRLVESAWAGMDAVIQYTWGGASGLQASFASSIDVTVGIGLAALALSALLALDQLLPRGSFELMTWVKGVSA